MTRTPTETQDPAPEARASHSGPVRPAAGEACPTPAVGVVERVADAVRDHGGAPGAGVGPAPEAAWIQRRDGESPAEYDARWRREVYAGDVPQLTVRAVLTGMAIGAVLAVSNVYVGLKAGWAMGVAITACVLSTAAWRGLFRVGVSRTPMSLLEQNCMQSTASGAGFTTGSILVTAVPAYMLMTGLRIEPQWLVLWTFFVSLLGLAIVVPMKRQLLHYDRLAWPSSVAAAQTLRSLHQRGRYAVVQARRLFASAGLAALVRWAMDNQFSWWKLPRWPAALDLPGHLAGQPAAAYTLGIDTSPLYFAAGALLGTRVATWMMVGSAITFGAVAPWMHAQGFLPEVSYPRIMLDFALWLGAALMVSSSLTALVLQWRMFARGLSGLARLLRRRPNAASSPADVLAPLEVPGPWAWAGALCAAAGILVMGEWVFGIPWPLGLLGVLLTVVGVVVAARATGETDITPAGSIARASQLGYGAIAPHSVAANLLGTSIVTTGATTASDLLLHMKCGHFLGAQPRRQYLAHLLGVAAGTIVVVPAFLLLVPDASVLGSASLPAPAAQSFRAMAGIAAGGLSQLGSMARWGLAIGVGLGVIFTLLEDRRPRWRKWIPSAMALGMGAVLPFQITVSFFVGGVIADRLSRRSERAYEDGVVPVSSGLIAGDSLMGVFLALLMALGLMGS